MGRRRTMAALTAGLVLMMTGCTGAAPQGEELYDQGAARYFPMAEDLHTVLLAIHEGQWTIEGGSHGAWASSCQRGLSGETGWFLDYVRTFTADTLDSEAASTAAADAFAALGLSPEVTVRGEGNGDAEEHSIVAEGERIGRAVVTIRPARHTVRVSAQTPCLPGNAHDLTAMVLGEERIPKDAARRIPAFEGPDSVPQFYFPADGPIYWEEDGTPVDPQPPVVTDPPEAPYGE